MSRVEVGGMKAEVRWGGESEGFGKTIFAESSGNSDRGPSLALRWPFAALQR